MKKAETATPLPVHKEVEFAEFSIKSPQICQIKWLKIIKLTFTNRDICDMISMNISGVCSYGV